MGGRKEGGGGKVGWVDRGLVTMVEGFVFGGSFVGRRGVVLDRSRISSFYSGRRWMGEEDRLRRGLVVCSGGRSGAMAAMAATAAVVIGWTPGVARTVAWETQPSNVVVERVWVKEEGGVKEEGEVAEDVKARRLLQWFIQAGLVTGALLTSLALTILGLYIIQDRFVYWPSAVSKGSPEVNIFLLGFDLDICHEKGRIVSYELRFSLLLSQEIWVAI